MDKIELFAFLLIYITIVGFVTVLFAPTFNHNTASTLDESGVRDPGTIGANPLTTAPTFIGLVIAFITALFQLLTFRIPFVPVPVGILLAIPGYVFIIVVVDLIVDLVNAFSNFWDSVIKFWT